jgi:uncharacterized membrane protein YdjX (TVP38/TMEM64 family)
MQITRSAAPQDAPEAGAKGESRRQRLRLLLRWIPVAGIAVVLILSYAFGLHEYLSVAGVRRHQAALIGFVDANLARAALTYILVYIAVVTVSFPGAGILTITGGFLFGAALGTALAAFAATIGATLIFLIARSSFGDIIARRAGPRAQRLRQGFLEEGFSYLLFLRLVPLFPFWLVNLAAALFGMRLLPYVAGTAIGGVAPTFVFAFFGQGLGTALEGEGGPASAELLIGLVLLGLMALLPPLVRRWRRRA